MTINLQIPEKTTLKPSITVFGVGGGGGNAVANMIRASLEGVNFVVANTDAQALAGSPCMNKIQLGEHVTRGLGAGSYPEVGCASAEESAQEIKDYLNGSNMLFVTAGMGGGTGTGAAPVVARLAREEGILTVGVVTKPFHFEGAHRMKSAEQGLAELQKYVDTLIVIPNQNLFRIADKNTTFLDAFNMADEVLHSGVRGITDLMVMPGLINLDFSDVRAIMSEMGKAMMGTGEGQGEQRAIMAAEAAIANPLLDNVSMRGARGVLINITGGPDLTLFEVDEAANRIREEVDSNANIIFGSIFDKNMSGKVRVSVVATGIDSVPVQEKSRVSVTAPMVNTPETQITNQPAQPKRQDFSDRHAIETEGAFIPPEPLTFVPEQTEQPAAEEYPVEEMKTRDVHTPPTSYYDEEAELEISIKPEVAKNHGNQGFFGGLFGRKPANTLPAEAEKTTTRTKEIHRNEDGSLDIPAVLRRKPGSQ
jgi:cell division protein FtsZ